jgi:hypothetical protein
VATRLAEEVIGSITRQFSSEWRMCVSVAKTTNVSCKKCFDKNCGRGELSGHHQQLSMSKLFVVQKRGRLFVSDADELLIANKRFHRPRSIVVQKFARAVLYRGFVILSTLSFGNFIPNGKQARLLLHIEQSLGPPP